MNRTCIHSVVWALLAMRLFNLSTEQDKTKDPQLTLKAQALAPPGTFLFAITLTIAAVEAETGRKPELTTGGGTSDARYINDVCPVAELGVRNEMAHKVDEHIPVDEIETLCRIYYRLLAGYFAAA